MGFFSPMFNSAASSEINGKRRSSIQNLIHHDEATGKPCFKFSLPSPDVLSRLSDVFQQWCEKAGMGRR